MKFGQLIECNMKIIEKSFAKCDAETSPRLFSEKWKYTVSEFQTAHALWREFYFQM